MFVVYCFFNYAATTESYTYLHTLALHDALPICDLGAGGVITAACPPDGWELEGLALAQGLRLMLIAHQGSAFERRNNFAAKQVEHERTNITGTKVLAGTIRRDRKSTRLNSSH